MKDFFKKVISGAGLVIFSFLASWGPLSASITTPIANKDVTMKSNAPLILEHANQLLASTFILDVNPGFHFSHYSHDSHYSHYSHDSHFSHYSG